METTDSMPPLVICDAGPLIHLDELGGLDLLADFKSIIVPDAVFSEVELHRPAVFSKNSPSLDIPIKMLPCRDPCMSSAILTTIPKISSRPSFCPEPLSQSTRMNSSY